MISIENISQTSSEISLQLNNFSRKALQYSIYCMDCNNTKGMVEILINTSSDDLILNNLIKSELDYQCLFGDTECQIQNTNFGINLYITVKHNEN